MFKEHEPCRHCRFLYSVSQLSHRGLCDRCAKERVLIAVRSLKERKGWIWEKWKRNYIASLYEVMDRLEEHV